MLRHWEPNAPFCVQRRSIWGPASGSSGWFKNRTSGLSLSQPDAFCCEELQQAGARRAEVTMQSLINEAEEARCLAMRGNRPSAAVAAIVCKAKLAGVWDAPEGAAEDYPRRARMRPLLNWLDWALK